MIKVDGILIRGAFEHEICCAGLRSELFVQTKREKKDSN
jgi:hypothetical protein